ncbi:MAG: T9SS type A sorting domain-containing protein [Saprospiraceae bacterium]|nr:T9SS type A sorting domain-containing protein [Saprospiraceae bacterium]
MEIIMSFPASVAYSPNGGAAGVVASGFGTSFSWVYDPGDNALYGYNNVVLQDGDGGLITVQVIGNSVISNGQTVSQATDFLNCAPQNDGSNDNFPSNLTVTTPLPVKLSNFKTRTSNCDGILLSWNTETEINSKGFSIERSEDGGKFEAIGFVKSAINSEINQDYAFKDEQITSNGTYYYRLVSVDLDGTFKISETVAHEYNCYDVTDFSIYPNPTSDKLNVNFNGVKGQQLTLDLLDADGKLVRKINVDTSTSQELSVKDLPQGFYSLQFNIGEQTINRRFIKVE